MDKFKNILLFGAVGLAILVGCKGTSPKEETRQEPAEAETMVEESFEEGDTGTLTSAPEASTESGEDPQNDSQ